MTEQANKQTANLVRRSSPWRWTAALWIGLLIAGVFNASRLASWTEERRQVHYVSQQVVTYRKPVLSLPRGVSNVAQECRGLNGFCPKSLTGRGSPGRECAGREACWHPSNSGRSVTRSSLNLAVFGFSRLANAPDARALARPRLSWADVLSSYA